MQLAKSCGRRQRVLLPTTEPSVADVVTYNCMAFEFGIYIRLSSTLFFVCLPYIPLSIHVTNFSPSISPPSTTCFPNFFSYTHILYKISFFIHIHHTLSNFHLLTNTVVCTHPKKGAGCCTPHLTVSYTNASTVAR
jgi:hypothetical protein